MFKFQNAAIGPPSQGPKEGKATLEMISLTLLEESGCLLKNDTNESDPLKRKKIVDSSPTFNEENSLEPVMNIKSDKAKNPRALGILSARLIGNPILSKYPTTAKNR